MAVEAKGEAEKKGLMGVVGEAVVGEIGEFIGFEIEDGERLFFAGGVGAVAAVEEDGKFRIGRERSGAGKIVDGARMAGDFDENSTVGQVDRLLLSTKRKRKKGQNEGKEGLK